MQYTRALLLLRCPPRYNKPRSTRSSLRARHAQHVVRAKWNVGFTVQTELAFVYGGKHCWAVRVFGRFRHSVVARSLTAGAFDWLIDLPIRLLPDSHTCQDATRSPICLPCYQRLISFIKSSASGCMALWPQCSLGKQCLMFRLKFDAILLMLQKCNEWHYFVICIVITCSSIYSACCLCYIFGLASLMWPYPWSCALTAPLLKTSLVKIFIKVVPNAVWTIHFKTNVF